MIIYYHYELALEPLSDIFRSLAAFSDALIELYCQLLSTWRVVAAPNDEIFWFDTPKLFAVKVDLFPCVFVNLVSCLRPTFEPKFFLTTTMGLQQLVTFTLVVDFLLAPAMILENELAILSFDLLIWVVVVAGNTCSYEKALA